MSVRIEEEGKEGIKWANHKELLTDQDWKKWTFENLPNKDYYVTDIDSMPRDKAGNFSLIEIKRQNAVPSMAQQVSYSILEKVIQAGVQALNNKVDIDIYGTNYVLPINFTGCHLLQLSNSTFENSELTFDGVKMSEQELIDILSFKRVI